MLITVLLDANFFIDHLLPWKPQLYEYLNIHLGFGTNTYHLAYKNTTLYLQLYRNLV